MNSYSDAFRYKQFTPYNKFYFDKYNNRFPNFVLEKKIKFFPFDRNTVAKIAKCPHCLTDIGMTHFFTSGESILNCVVNHVEKIICRVCYTEVGFKPYNLSLHYLHKYRLPPFLSEISVTKRLTKRRFSI